jgi:hypothetical protein
MVIIHLIKTYSKGAKILWEAVILIMGKSNPFIKIQGGIGRH